MTTDVERRGPASAIEARLAAAGLPPLPRLAWIEVDLAILEANARRLRRALPADASLAVVVKADGYGHGLLAAARAALRGGAAFLVVATLDEALTLRDAAIRSRILVQYPVPPSMIRRALAAGLDLVVADPDSVAALARCLASGSEPLLEEDRAQARVHLGIDTGLARGGVRPDEAVAAARRLLDAGLPRLTGTWSHLASPEDAAAVASQVGRFDDAIAALRAAGVDPGLRHLDATGGLLGGQAPVYDLVRVGLAFYGVVPRDQPVGPSMEGLAREVAPALTLQARAATVTEVPPGTAVGYGGTWVAARPSVIATLPLGYADGWTRAYAGGSWGVASGRRAPLVGRVSSDAIAVDVTEIPTFGTGDEVTLLGGEGMSVHDLAALRASIPWEVLDALSPRLPRVYTERGIPVGVRFLDGRRPVHPLSHGSAARPLATRPGASAAHRGGKRRPQHPEVG